ncbi:protein of unknown function [Xenorhabdus poinarii G6]|uniref:Uncharacterized protein n=1 Tax=Xenorhabdus poinarii G6 TaxID=1354304 RepID=A0A068R6E5_9GAMM|nr:protein of unknown function [Xenorhabdus poinarii G6]
MTGALTTAKSRHHPALPHECLPDFLNRLSAYRGRLLTKIAVELALLKFVYSSVLRFARWQAIDFENAVWKISTTRQPIKEFAFLDVAGK